MCVLTVDCDTKSLPAACVKLSSCTTETKLCSCLKSMGEHLFQCLQGNIDFLGSIVPTEGKAQRTRGIGPERFVSVGGAVQAYACADSVSVR